MGFLCYHESDFVGKSIQDLSYLSHFKGIAIFDLDKKDETYLSEHGSVVWEDVCMRDFIRKFPEYKNAVVQKYNDFFGTIVLRIRNVYQYKNKEEEQC